MPLNLVSKLTSRLKSDRAKGSKHIKGKQDGGPKENTVASPSSSTADSQMPTASSQMQPEQHKDSSTAPVAGGNQSNTHGPDTAKSLWGRAYDELTKDQLDLVEKYEKLLSRELPETSEYQLQSLLGCR